MCLIVTRRNQESIRIGEDVTVTVACIGSVKVKLIVQAPATKRVIRAELIDHQPDVASHRRTGHRFASPMLVLTRRCRESIRIGSAILVTVESVELGRAQLAISAPYETEVMRIELLDREPESQPPQKATA